jgi:hypothetical protein
LNFKPQNRIGKSVKGMLDRFMHAIGQIHIKQEASAGFVFGMIDDAVHQPSGRAGDRDTAITHGNHLCQTTGLIPGWHEQHIGTRVDPVREGSVKFHCHLHLVRELCLELKSFFLKIFLASAQNNCLPSTGRKGGESFQGEIRPFLHFHPTHKGE